MTDSRITATVIDKNSVLLYLKSQQLLSSNVDVLVRNASRGGRIQVRKGQVVAATCGKLSGNGALMTLLTIRDGEMQEEKADQPVGTNVSLSLLLMERLLNKLPSSTQGDTLGDEEEILQQAVHLFYQFRRKEAGARLVEILRSNRFYYPAWLWHSRLMTRQDTLKRALTEARTWGNHDLAIKREREKIEPFLGDSQESVNRCIFCYSLVAAGEVRCKHCQGMVRVVEKRMAAASRSGELVQALQPYERELQLHPENSRIAYCICLGYFSLDNIDRAREYIGKALRISAQEPVFNRAAALLKALAAPVAQPASIQKTETTSRRAATGKTILVVEDSQTSRRVISMLLERYGYIIIEARNGSEALQKSGEMVPDLILLDVMLPDISGHEVLSKLRQNDQLANIPVIMLTGKTSLSDQMQGLHHGSNEYLTKPFDPSKLLGMLEKYLKQATPKSAAVQAAPQKAQPAAPAMRSPAVETTPVARKIVARPPTMPQTVVLPPRETGKSDKLVLVVEDSPTSRKVITMVLAKRGYAIKEVATGAAALRALEEAVPDLILLDAMLPDMTGYDILFRVKKDERFKNVPVVMLTAKNNPLDRQKGMRAGSAAYLTKPFDPKKLLAVIDEWI